MRQRLIYLLLVTFALSACHAQPQTPPAGWHAGCAPYWDSSATPPPGGWAPNCPPPANTANHSMTPPPGWHAGCKPYWDETATPPPGGWAPNCPGSKGWSLLPTKPIHKPVDITANR